MLRPFLCAKMFIFICQITFSQKSYHCTCFFPVELTHNASLFSPLQLSLEHCWLRFAKGWEFHLQQKRFQRLADVSLFLSTFFFTCGRNYSIKFRFPLAAAMHLEYSFCSQDRGNTSFGTCRLGCSPKSNKTGRVSVEFAQSSSLRCLHCNDRHHAQHLR